MKTINLSKLAPKLEAYKNCIKSGNEGWQEKHYHDIFKMLENLPHGSGIDAGVVFDYDNSTSNKLIFLFGFHHLNEGGFYDGWTEHKLVVTPTFGYYDMRITGSNKNDIKDYLYDLFNSVFSVTDIKELQP